MIAVRRNFRCRRIVPLQGLPVHAVWLAVQPNLSRIARAVSATSFSNVPDCAKSMCPVFGQFTNLATLRDQPGEGKVPEMECFQAKDGRRLAYADSGGDGPPVLCLAGLTRNSRDFDELAVHLAPRFRVLRLDSRGRGRSEHAADPFTEYTVPVEAGDVIALLDHLGLSRIALIGTSRGGILGMTLAALDPGRISALVLNDIGAVVEGRGLLRILETLGHPPAASTFAEAAEQLADRNRSHFPDVSLEAWERHARQVHDSDNGRPVLSYDPKLRAVVAAAMDMDQPSVSLWPLFDAVLDLPVLAIRGEHSDILSAETLSVMATLHRGLIALTLPGRGHAPFLNEPLAVQGIGNFLSTFARAG